MKYSLFLLLTIFLFSRCSMEKSDAELKIELKERSKEVCVDESCAEVNFSWPIILNTPKAEKINFAIDEKVSNYLELEDNYSDLDSGVSAFFQSFKDFITEFPDASSGWEVSLNVKVSSYSLGVLSIRFDEFNYMGGAHPNSSQQYLNFDLETGEQLSNEDLILNQAELLRITARYFKAFHEIPESGSIAEDQRFFIPEPGFFLPKSMGYEGDDFSLIYNPYEIGPYSIGATSLKIPLEELKGVVKTGN